MKKINKIWSIGSKKRAARQAVKEKVVLSAQVTNKLPNDIVNAIVITTSVPAKTTSKAKKHTARRIKKYELLKSVNPVVKKTKVDLGKEYMHKSIFVGGIAVCSHCNSYDHDACKHIGTYDRMFTCPHCGKVTPTREYNDLVAIVPTFMTVKEYANGSITVNCFAKQYVSYIGKTTKVKHRFLSIIEGVGQVIFASNGQTYVKPFRSIKSGRALHVTAEAATKAEAARFENVTYQGNDKYIYHYRDSEYNFYTNYISVLEDRCILKHNQKLLNRFPYLDNWDISNLESVYEATKDIVWFNYDQKPINMWDVLKKKIGKLPKDITPKAFKEKLMKYCQYSDDSDVKYNISYCKFDVLALTYLFRRLNDDDPDMFCDILAERDYHRLGHTLILKANRHKKNHHVKEDLKILPFNEEVPW